MGFEGWIIMVALEMVVVLVMKYLLKCWEHQGRSFRLSLGSSGDAYSYCSGLFMA